MRRLFVAAPCICRSDVHNVCYPILLSMMKDIASHVHFVVNIDPCSGKNNETQVDTEANLVRLFNDAGVGYEIHMGQKGCFFTATKKILSRIDTLMTEQPESAVLWFEDDKKLHKDPRFKGYLERTDEYVIHLWRAAPKSPSFHPCLWSPHTAKKYLIDSIVKETVPYDPELLMMHHWKRYFKGEVTLTHYNFSCDVGRQWQAENGLKKWVREHTKNVPVTYV